MGPWRGIFAKKGTPQEAIDALVAAIEEAQADRHLEGIHRTMRRMTSARSRLRVRRPSTFCHNEYKDLHDYMVEQGTLVKDYDDLK